MMGWLRRLLLQARAKRRAELVESERKTPIDVPLVIHVSVAPPTLPPMGPSVAKATPRSRVDRSVITPLEVPKRPPRPTPKGEK